MQAINKTQRVAALLLTSTVLLTACGGGVGGTAKIPTPPAAAFIPAANAAPGTSAGGQPLTSVLSSPNAYEVRLLELINELRTKGTIAGVNYRVGTCAASFAPSANYALSYSGVLGHAAQKHAEYMGRVGYFAHNEVNLGSTGSVTNEPSASQYFYGATRHDRITNSLKVAGLTQYSFLSEQSGENVAGGTPGAGTEGYATPETVMVAWLNSAGHCSNLINPDWAYFGTGYFRNDAPETSVEPRRHQNSWVQLFAKSAPDTKIVWQY